MVIVTTLGVMLGMRATILVEFSGICRDNPVRLMRVLREAGGRVVSYDSGTRMFIGTLRLIPTIGQEHDKKIRDSLENVFKGLDSCRVWAKIVLMNYRVDALGRLQVMKSASSSGEVLIVKLPNFTYALWADRKSSNARMAPIGPPSMKLPGDLSEISYPCEEASELIQKLLHDLTYILRLT